MAERQKSTLEGLDDAVGKLCALSNELNTRTNKLNLVIASVTERLKTAGLGIEHWLDGFAYVKEEPMVGETFEGWSIGWIKDRSANAWGWTLVCQRGEYRVVNGQDNEGNHLEWHEPIRDEDDEEVVDSPLPLLSAPRYVRVGAIEVLPQLIAELTEKANAGLKDLAGVRDQLDSWKDPNEIDF